MAERSVDVENIELTIDDQSDEAVNIDIQQSTDQVRVLEIGTGPALANGHIPSQGISSNGMESTDEDEEGSFEGSGEYSFSEKRVEAKPERDDTIKQYEEWIFVDVNKSTHEIKENLLVVSSVYGPQECCVIL